MIRANRENREWENEAWDKQADKVGESREQAQEDPIQKRENGQTDITGKNGNHIELISIIGEIEGHENLSGNTKTTKYEHILPKLAEIEESGETEGVLVLINTVGGDVSCGLALAEMIASLSKPTVSLVIGDSHSIGVPLAVAVDHSFIVPTGTMMVHPVRMGAYGYYNAEELQKYIEAMNAIRESIVGLYVKKTGRDKDEVAGWMDETSWWTAAQAKENGFIDELTDEADGAVIENRDGLLFVNSVNTHLPFDKAPNFVQSSKAAPASCSVNNNCHKEVTNMANEIKTVDDLRGAYPALVNEIEEAAANKATSDERQRIHDIEDMALSGSEALTNEAKFTKPVSASEYAVAMMKAAKESGNAWLNGAKADADKSGMGGVKNDSGTGGSAGKQDEFMDAPEVN